MKWMELGEIQLLTFIAEEENWFDYPDYFFRGHSERGEAVADDGRPRRATGAEGEAEVLRQGESQANQSVSVLALRVTYSAYLIV